MGGIINWLTKRSMATEVVVSDALRGECHLEGDVVVGWVENTPLVVDRHTSVNALREGKVVASCKVGSDNGNQRLPFALPLAGRFTATEIALGRVILRAKNKYGDGGKIRFDGAAQLEAIRDHIGIPVETVIDLDFSKGGNARPYLGEGWSIAEGSRTWTNGKTSIISFTSPSKAGMYLLRIRTAAFITDIANRQFMDVYINDELIASFVSDDWSVRFREIHVSGECLTNRQSSVLRLHLPYAACPHDHLANGDRRLLAFAFHRMSLVRILEEEM